MLAKVLKIIGMIIGGLALGVLIAFLFGWLVMLLWNWLMPNIFGLKEISFWQAWGLVILSHILFKSGGHHEKDDHHNGHWKNHFRKQVKDHMLDQKDESEPVAAT